MRPTAHLPQSCSPSGSGRSSGTSAEANPMTRSRERCSSAPRRCIRISITSTRSLGCMARRNCRTGMDCAKVVHRRRAQRTLSREFNQVVYRRVVEEPLRCLHEVCYPMHDAITYLPQRRANAKSIIVSGFPLAPCSSCTIRRTHVIGGCHIGTTSAAPTLGKE